MWRTLLISYIYLEYHSFNMVSVRVFCKGHFCDLSKVVAYFLFAIPFLIKVPFRRYATLRPRKIKTNRTGQ